MRKNSSYSKKGNAVSVFSANRVMHLKFDDNAEMEQFVFMMSGIVHKYDERPLYELGKDLFGLWSLSYRTPADERGDDTPGNRG